MSGLEMMQHYHTWLHDEHHDDEGKGAGHGGHNSDPPHTVYDNHSKINNQSTKTPSPPPPTRYTTTNTNTSNTTSTTYTHTNNNNNTTHMNNTNTNTMNTKLFKRNNTLIWGMSATANNYDQQAGLKLGMHIFSIKPVCNNTILYMLSIRKNMSTLSQWIRAVVTHNSSGTTNSSSTNNNTHKNSNNNTTTTESFPCEQHPKNDNNINTTNATTIINSSSNSHNNINNYIVRSP